MLGIYLLVLTLVTIIVYIVRRITLGNARRARDYVLVIDAFCKCHDILCETDPRCGSVKFSFNNDDFIAIDGNPPLLIMNRAFLLPRTRLEFENVIRQIVPPPGIEICLWEENSQIVIDIKGHVTPTYASNIDEEITGYLTILSECRDSILEKFRLYNNNIVNNNAAKSGF